MNNNDIVTLREHLAIGMHNCRVQTMFLKDFTRESQLTEKLGWVNLQLIWKECRTILVKQVCFLSFWQPFVRLFCCCKLQLISFSPCFSSFYSGSAEGPGIMIVQCESANDSIEMLDSVRYIIQRETNSCSDSENLKYVNHTILLLSVARGRQFSGFQGTISFT